MEPFRFTASVPLVTDVVDLGLTDYESVAPKVFRGEGHRPALRALVGIEMVLRSHIGGECDLQGPVSRAQRLGALEEHGYPRAPARWTRVADT